MKLTIVTTASGGGLITIADFDADSALDLTHELQHPSSNSMAPDFLTFDLDDGVTTYVARAHIVRVDIEEG